MIRSMPVGSAPARLAAALLVAMLALSVNVAHAQDSDTESTESSTSVSPVDEFSKQLEQFQKSVPELNKKIQDGAATIDGTSDVAKARADIEALRDEVSTLLGAVADNGPVSQLGVKALDHIHAKLKQLSQDQRFKPQERQYLIEQWQRLESQTEAADKDLDAARAQFVGLLQTLQQNEDFIGELLEIRQAQRALEVIRGLTQNIRDASSQLNKLIGSIKPPGA
jgi:DNA repair exonuclease SbcCD ATPase subunit